MRTFVASLLAAHAAASGDAASAHSANWIQYATTWPATPGTITGLENLEFSAATNTYAYTKVHRKDRKVTLETVIQIEIKAAGTDFAKVGPEAMMCYRFAADFAGGRCVLWSNLFQDDDANLVYTV